ncbi:MAG TPA: hypothetical protein VGG62_04640, partial [Terracidiphilus sp.]
MRLRTLSKTAKNQRVLGGQGIPQKFHTIGKPSQTPGSTMNRARFAAAPRSAFSPFWIALVLLMAILSLASVSLSAESASNYYKRGEAAEAAENYDVAFDNYQKAAQMAPKDLRYRTALVRVQLSATTLHVSKGRTLEQAGDDQGALGEFLHALEIDPSNDAAQQEIAKIRAREAQAPPPAPESPPEMAGVQQEIDSIGAPINLRP